MNDKPVVMFRLTEDARGDEVVVTRERRVSGKLSKTVQRKPP